MSDVQGDNDEYQKGIHEILYYLEPLIKITGNSVLLELESMIKYLEEMDDGYDQYILVNNLRSKTKETFRIIIEEELRKCGKIDWTPENMKVLAPKILYEIQNSSVYKKFVAEERAVLSIQCQRVAKKIINEDNTRNLSQLLSMIFIF